jgi:hypothetical protein
MDRRVLVAAAGWGLACGGGPEAQSPAAPPVVPAPSPIEASVVAQLPDDCGLRGRPRFAVDGTLMVVCNSFGHHGGGSLSAEQLRALMESTESVRFFGVPELAEVRPAVLLPMPALGSAVASDARTVALADRGRLVVLPTDGGPPTVDRVVEGLTYPIDVGAAHVAYTTQKPASASSGRFFDSTVHVITLDGAEVGSFAASNDVFGVRIGPDGIVYLVQDRGRVDRWDPATQTLLAPLQVPSDPPDKALGAQDVAFAPDGSAIAVVSSTGHYARFALSSGDLTGSGRVDWNPTAELGLEVAAEWSGTLYVKAAKEAFAACDPASGLAASTHRLSEPAGPQFAASPDGKWLMVGRSLLRAP